MKKKLILNLVLGVGIIGMLMAVAGTFVEGGSLLQKILFLAGAVFLFTTAIINKQTMFIALQSIIIVGAVLGFFPSIPNVWKFIIMLVPVIIAVAYLIGKKYFKKDPWGILGSVGLLAIALGFATDAVMYPIMFYTFLIAGGAIVAIYSGIGFFYYKIRITILWLILNVVFAIYPLISLIKLL